MCNSQWVTETLRIMKSYQLTEAEARTVLRQVSTDWRRGFYSTLRTKVHCVFAMHTAEPKKPEFISDGVSMYEERLLFAACYHKARSEMVECRRVCLDDRLPPYSECTAYFLHDDGLSGFVMTSNKMVCAFNVSGETRFDKMTTLALNMYPTGVTLECFEPLNEVYARHGWKERYSTVFEDHLKPTGWDVKVHGRPNIVRMERQLWT